MRAAALALVLCVPAVHAASLAECAAVADGAQRLACYDALAGRSPPSPPPASAVAPALAAPAAVAAPAAPALGAESLPAAQPAVAARGATAQAHIAGAFSGWRRGLRIALDNGQVWQVIGDDQVEVSERDRPAVTVEKGMVSYFLRVEHVPGSAKVRRVE